MTITVFSKKPCVQCNATFRALDKKDAEYDVISISDDPKALEFIQSLKYAQAPVVIISDGPLVFEESAVIDSWSGFVPDKINEYTSKESVAA